MPVELFTNQATTTVTSGGTTAPAAGTAETWTVTSSSTFPAASSAVASQFRVVEDDATRQSEVVLVTNVSGTTWTVTRGAEGTTPVAHPAGFTVVQTVSSGVLAALMQNGSYEGASVSASETTTSSSFTDLATVGPTVTRTIGASGRALVVITAGLVNSVQSGYSLATVEVSGASTVAPIFENGIYYNAGVANQEVMTSRTLVLSGLTPGSNTFRMKYAKGGVATQATFLFRFLMVVSL